MQRSLFCITAFFCLTLAIKMDSSNVQSSDGVPRDSADSKHIPLNEQQQQQQQQMAELSKSAGPTMYQHDSHRVKKMKSKYVHEIAQRFWVMFRTMWLSHVDQGFIPQTDVDHLLRTDRDLYSTGEMPNIHYCRQRAKLVSRLFNIISKQITTGLHEQRTKHLNSDFDRVLYHFVYWAAIEGSDIHHDIGETVSVSKQSMELLRESNVPLAIHLEFGRLRSFLTQSSLL